MWRKDKSVFHINERKKWNNENEKNSLHALGNLYGP